MAAVPEYLLSLVLGYLLVQREVVDALAHLLGLSLYFYASLEELDFCRGGQEDWRRVREVRVASTVLRPGDLAAPSLQEVLKVAPGHPLLRPGVVLKVVEKDHFRSKQVFQLVGTPVWSLVYVVDLPETFEEKALGAVCWAKYSQLGNVG